MATHIFVFFPLCKLKILPTLRPCNFKSKSQSCLEKKISAKTVINPAWKSIGKAVIALCYTLCGVKSALSCKLASSELLLEQLQPSAYVLSFFADPLPMFYRGNRGNVAP